MKCKGLLSAIASRTLVYVFLLCIFVSGSAQRLSVNDSRMTFTSNAELELITATSNEVKGLIDPTTNQFAFTVSIKSFEGFNSALQREHFNEKYLESAKFPSARFSGKIIEPIDFSVDRSYNVRAKGVLDIHGEKQTRIIKTKIRIQNGAVHLEAHFFVPLSDHNISIPTIVSQKIATEIEVAFTASMSPQQL